MKNLRNHFYRVKNSYPLFTIILLLSLILLIFFFSLQAKFYKQETIKELELGTVKAQTEFIDILDYSEHIMNMMNSQIKNNPKDKEFINNIVQKYRTNSNLSHNFPWTIFSWIDENGFLVVDAVYGIMKNPIDLSSRDYVPLLKDNPNRLVIGNPVIGSTSKEWMIAGGVGVLDENQKYVGAMTIGFRIKALLSSLKLTVDDQYIDIILINRNLHVITLQEVINYKDYNFGISDKNFKKNLKNFVSSKEKTFTKISVFDYKANYKLSKVEGTNYLFLVKYNNLAVSKDLRMIYLGRISELLMIGLISALMLFIIYKKERKHRYKMIVASRSLHKATTSNISKTRLINIVSHDIKNYAFAISGLAKLVLEKKSAAEIKSNEDLQLIEYIATHSDELRYFVADLLDYQQRETGDFTLKKIEDCDIKILIKRMILLNKNLALENKILVETDIANNIPILKCDIRRFKQILINLISNATKYSKEGSKILITAKYLSHDPKLYIEVKDQGFGMSKEEIKMALEGRGTEINKTDFNKQIDSYGIGLPIVKKLVELHNGRLEIDSEKNVGTAVKLYFNLEEAQKNKKNILQQHHKNILLAEDNWVNTKVITAILKDTNCNVDCVRDGKEALDALNSGNKKYHLILMDIEMPIMNGIEAIKIILSNEELKNIPIITITSNSNDKILEEFGASTKIKHINKTSSKKQILDVIVQTLEESSLKY